MPLSFFLCLKILSLVAYAYLARLYEQQVDVAHWMIYSINAAEDLCSAMLLVVMLTLIMQYSRKQYAGTDFTFQVAIMATVSGVLYTLSGVCRRCFGLRELLTVDLCCLRFYALYRSGNGQSLRKALTYQHLNKNIDHQDRMNRALNHFKKVHCVEKIKATLKSHWSKKRYLH